MRHCEGRDTLVDMIHDSDIVVMQCKREILTL